LSLFVGVLAIVIIQAGAGAARDAIIANAILTSGRALTLGLNTDTGRQSFMLADRLRIMLDRSLSPLQGTSVLLIDIGSTAIAEGHVEMTLVKGNLRAIRPFPIKSGTWIEQKVGNTIPVVINEAASSNLGLFANTTAAMRLGYVNEKKTARIVGVVDDGFKEPNAYAPLDLTQPWVKQLSYLVPVRLLVHTDNTVDTTELTNLIRTEYARVFDTKTVPEINRLDTQDSFGGTLTVISLIFSVVAGLSLVVGSLGILNIGLATLRERSDELSLRRSFGATKLQVVAIIVLEGQIVALGAASLALYVGLVSIAPAIRASRVPIASIMRV
jgi:putative ABC transport system permease protein